MKGRAGKILHPESKRLLEKYLKMLAKYGEDRTFRYIKKYEVVPMRREKVKKMVKFFHIGEER